MAVMSQFGARFGATQLAASFIEIASRLDIDGE
jgi:hypothetical protein